jgi:hypothetical protein
MKVAGIEGIAGFVLALLRLESMKWIPRGLPPGISFSMCEGSIAKPAKTALPASR